MNYNLFILNNRLCAFQAYKALLVIIIIFIFICMCSLLIVWCNYDIINHVLFYQHKWVKITRYLFPLNKILVSNIINEKNLYSNIYNSS